ncbi:predicted protein [Sclerotinia sclerotiorum 1980 UF-70]|uniref:Uncharacterized protein n=1 Tax=Sclerotinia sclerotiorum (strain ATCC 18683 / 1980 / Ss-1) TaxID=665079 RepID=A7EC97_SCLS1|nr:predicted protein [Sclerotinia sclerotiorum 1980 UF-70]EDO00076.1 predicted protein [Sclerotinia sclerotiorum 1980 UF-70]
MARKNDSILPHLHRKMISYDSPREKRLEALPCMKDAHHIIIYIDAYAVMAELSNIVIAIAAVLVVTLSLRHKSEKRIYHSVPSDRFILEKDCIIQHLAGQSEA